jgi:hypothetical protein
MACNDNILSDLSDIFIAWFFVMGQKKKKYPSSLSVSFKRIMTVRDFCFSMIKNLHFYLFCNIFYKLQICITVGVLMVASGCKGNG